MHASGAFRKISKWLLLGIIVLLFLEAIVAQDLYGEQDSWQQEGGLVLEQNRGLQQTEFTEPDPSVWCENSSSIKCIPYYHRATSRLGHNTRLYAGEAACNHQFMFGVTENGVFQWKDCSTGETKVFYKASSAEDVYFVMLPDASWNVYEHGILKWKRECNLDVHFYPQCLSSHDLDCPYIHLRKSGRIVLNSIAKDGSWDAQGATRVYDSIDD